MGLPPHASPEHRSFPLKVESLSSKRHLCRLSPFLRPGHWAPGWAAGAGGWGAGAGWRSTGGWGSASAGWRSTGGWGSAGGWGAASGGAGATVTLKVDFKMSLSSCFRYLPMVW